MVIGSVEESANKRAAGKAGIASLFTVMRRRKVLFGAATLALAAALAALACFEAQEPCPLVLNVERVEPAGMFDDSGLEMRLVTLSITERDKPLSGSERRLFVRDAGAPIEAKVADRWVRVEGRLWQHSDLFVGIKRELMFAMPARTVSCRLRLQYNRAFLTETRSLAISNRLPAWMPFYNRLWRWLRNSAYDPIGRWREINIEVPVPQEAASVATA
jgi:hypothetical protein